MPAKTRTPRPRQDGAVMLFTGFPGFIGARLIPRLLELRPDTRFVCLVQEKFQDAAADSVRALGRKHAGLDRRVEIVVGDITSPGLGLPEDEARKLHRKLTGCAAPPS